MKISKNYKKITLSLELLKENNLDRSELIVGLKFGIIVNIMVLLILSMMMVFVVFDYLDSSNRWKEIRKEFETVKEYYNTHGIEYKKVFEESWFIEGE